MDQSSRETGDPEIVLGLLTAIERGSALTQRKLAGDLGIALGLTNAYLHRCVRMGFVKMRQVEPNRYVYHLTPLGFGEKSRLTAEFLAVSFNFFHRVRGDFAVLLRQGSACGWRRVALFGAGDLAEIAVLSAIEAAIEIVCVIDPAQAGRRCAGLPVVADLAEAQRHAAPAGLDAIILTDTQATQERFDALRAVAAAHGLAPGRITAPSVLDVSAVSATAKEAS